MKEIQELMTTQTKRKSFIIHKDSLHILKDMTNEQAGIFIKAIDFYQQNNQLPELDFGLKMAIIPFINQFERDEENYKKTCEARREAGSTGGKQKVANASKCKQKVAKVADNKNENKNDSKSELIDINNFETFWSFYTPVAGRDGKSVDKGNKADAKKSYEKAIALNFTHETIMQALEFYLKECQKNARFTKHAVSWLNQAIRDEFKFEQSSVIQSQAPPQKLNRDQEQDRINEEFLKKYAQN